MSFFLLPQEQIYNDIPMDYIDAKHVWSTEKQASEHLLLGDIIKSELKFKKECFLGHVMQKSGEEQYFLMKVDLRFNLKGLFSMKCTRKNKSFNFSVDILGPGESYYKADNLHQAVQICRNIISQHSSIKEDHVCLKMDPLKRQIKLQMPLFLSPNWPTLKKSQKTNEVISLVVNTMLRPYLSLIDNTLRNIMIQDGRATSYDLTFQKQDKKLQSINNYSLLSNISTHIPCKPQNQALFSLLNVQNKKQSIKNMNQNKVKLQPFLIKNAQLFSYSTCGSPYSQNLTDQMCVTQMQKLMKTKIAIPIPAQSDQPEQNFMIQNRIEIENLKSLELERIKQGGFAHIYVTQIDFWYPYLSDGYTPNTNEPSNMFSELMVLKMELPSSDMFETDSQGIQKSRREHELSIISKLRTGKSIYIPKYYFPTNLHKHKNSILGQSLLMEHIPFKTLSQIIQQNSFCLSLHSKIGLMFSICQGLRYLRDFDIVHLDLKPNNIMNYYGSYIKLIDFGQSYHHELCGQFYQPGYTIPYSAPEIFSDQRKYFTSKTDVFSFGVIFYQMLFNKLPYDIHKNTTKLDHQMQQYLQYWYYSFEEGESYGEGKVMRILVGLISKCLSFNADSTLVRLDRTYPQANSGCYKLSHCDINIFNLYLIIYLL